jgi:signal transduction histidine kinase
LKLQGIFLIIFIFFEIAGYFYIISVRDQEVHEILNDNVEQNRILYDSIIESFQTRADMIFDSLSEKSLSIYYFIKNGWSEDEARKEMKDNLSGTFEYLKEKYGVQQLHFHTKDGRSLYRFHKPEAIGDSLRSRQSIVMVKEQESIIRGFEEGKNFNSMRNVYPIVFHGEFLGSVEISFSFDFMKKSASKILPNDYSFVIFDKKEHLVKKECFQNIQTDLLAKNFYNDFYLRISCDKTDGIREKSLPFKYINSLIREKVEDRLLNFEEFAVFQTSKDEYFSVSFIPIKSISGNGWAYFTAYETNSVAIKHQFELMRSRILILTFSLSIIFSLLYLFISKEFEMRELNKELKKKVGQEIEKNRRKDRVILQQSKLSAMAEMINSIAHHWRQPLNRISLEVLNIEEDFFYGDLNEESLQQHGESINQSLQYLSRVIDDFREFYKPPKEQELKDVVVVIKKSIEDLKREHTRIDVRNYLTEKYLVAFCDEFKQVIKHIVSNSLDAIEENEIEYGLVIISISQRSEKGILVSIKDNGGGIPLNISERMFEPYFTTKSEEQEATGMGLYVSKIIVETNMDGELSFIPHEKGSEFQIKLS